VALDNDVLELLEELAWDLALDRTTGNIRNPERLPWYLQPNQIKAHPAYNKLLAALERDPSLNQMFPEDDEAKRRIRSHRPSSIAEQLINFSIWRCTVGNSPSADCVLAYLRRGVGDLRTLMKRHPVKTPVWVGFGVNLPAGSVVKTPWGILRPWREADRSVAISAPGGSPHQGGGCILETEAEIIWTVLSSELDPGTIQCVGLEDERWKRISLAFLLVQNKALPRLSEPWFCSQAQGLGPGIVSASTRQFAEGPTITDQQLGDLEFWLNIIGNPSLSIIAVDRTTTMVSRVYDHTDALIDGVIVWENLFAKGDNNELSFRVSLNMACVLEDEPSKRIALQLEIKKLYQLRSQIVHGVFHANPWEMAKSRNRVQELTLLSLRRLLQTYPQLIGKQQDSYTRFVIEGLNPGQQT